MSMIDGYTLGDCSIFMGFFHWLITGVFWAIAVKTCFVFLTYQLWPKIPVITPVDTLQLWPKIPCISMYKFGTIPSLVFLLYGPYNGGLTHGGWEDGMVE